MQRVKAFSCGLLVSVGTEAGEAGSLVPHETVGRGARDGDESNGIKRRRKKKNVLGLHT